jgi:hypothetical protein
MAEGRWWHIEAEKAEITTMVSFVSNDEIDDANKIQTTSSPPMTIMLKCMIRRRRGSYEE